MNDAAKELIGLMAFRTLARDLLADARYPCCCGTEPYTDGNQCPKCFCIVMWERLGPVPPIDTNKAEVNDTI